MRFLRFVVFLAFFAALALTFAGRAQGDGPQPSMPPNITWTRSTIDGTGDVGQYASLALEPATGLPHISYFDATAHDLRHAYLTNNPINTPCTVANWECETWATTDDDGSYTAMGMRSNGNYGILYLNDTQDALYFRGDQGNGLPFANQQIDSIGTLANPFNDFQYDRNGIPHAVYAAGYSGFLYLRYAKYVGSGGNCSNDTWQCETIMNIPSGPLFASLGMTYYGSPRLAVGLANGLQYVRRVGGNGNCSGFWQCDEIETGFSVADVALIQPICQILCLSPVHIAYYDISNSRLKFATSVESGGNCGVGSQAGKWQCDIIETIGANGTYGVSLSMSNGQPYIAYTDGDDRTNTVLKIAYPAPNGNCGPTLNGAGTWQCETVDSGLRFLGGFPIYRNVGLSPSIGINSSGKAYISYYDSGTDDLLVAEGQLDAPPQPSGANKVYLPMVIR